MVVVVVVCRVVVVEVVDEVVVVLVVVVEEVVDVVVVVVDVVDVEVVDVVVKLGLLIHPQTDASTTNTINNVFVCIIPLPLDSLHSRQPHH